MKTAAQELDYVERTLTNLNRKSVRSRKGGEQKRLTIANVGILSGRALTAVRRAKELLGYPLLHQRHTARRMRTRASPSIESDYGEDVLGESHHHGN